MEWMNQLTTNRLEGRGTNPRRAGKVSRRLGRKRKTKVTSLIPAFLRKALARMDSSNNDTVPFTWSLSPLTLEHGGAYQCVYLVLPVFCWPLSCHACFP